MEREASNDVTECSSDDKTSVGMFVFSSRLLFLSVCCFNFSTFSTLCLQSVNNECSYLLTR